MYDRRDFPQGPPPEPELLLERQGQDDDEDELPRPVPKHKKVRRVKRPRRERDCGFCQGSDEHNKDGVPETMLSCSNCGRSGELSLVSGSTLNPHPCSWTLQATHRVLT